MNPYSMKRDKLGRFINGRYKPIRLCLYCKKNERRSGRKFCSFKCMGMARRGKITWMKGKKHSKASIKKLSESHKGQKAPNLGIKMPQYSGKSHWNWKGGITKLTIQIRESLEYKIWRKKVFERDNYTCQKCKRKKEVSGKLFVHHIESLEQILKKYHIKTLNQAIKCGELWDIKNGKTLCLDCHKLTDSYPPNLR